MKPVWAHKRTTCTYCGDTIQRGTPRLDEVIRKDGQFRRIHFHAIQPPCYQRWVEEWFSNHPQESVESAGGRPFLDITDEERKERQRLLARLSSLYRYYIPRLNLQTPITELSHKDLKRFQRFYKRRETIIKRLQELGGVPKRYAGVSTPML